VAEVPPITLDIDFRLSDHARKFLVSLGWTPPADDPAPGLFPPLGANGHHDPEHWTWNLWHMALYLPEGREALAFDLLAANGIEVYRAWPVERETHATRFTELERDAAREAPGGEAPHG
jgi:hypothetical protein